nr:Lrp/AsnC family transcriptional regulator [Bowmanella yangjiangensis]
MATEVQQRAITLDELDKAILRIVQANNLIAHAAIGEQVGLSTSAVRRRLQLLRKQGVISQDVAIVNPVHTGVTIILSLSFADETVQTYQAFNQQMAALPEVMQSYHVAGSEDYILIVHGPSLSWYESWSQEVFMQNPKIRRYDSRVVWSCRKFSTQLAL